MRVISVKKGREFWERHPETRTALVAWFKLVKHARWEDFAELRADFPADWVGKYTVFNVGGNKCRMVAVVHFNRGMVFVRHVLTHAEYDRVPGRTNDASGGPFHGDAD